VPKNLASDYSVLTKLGLSKTAIACYENLFNLGGASVLRLATILEIQRTSLYRVLRQLELKGFLNSVQAASQPTYFFAYRLDTALGNYASYQRREVKALIDQQKEVLIKRTSA
jgi:sugar-specific transcriptional regulator TrmB